MIPVEPAADMRYAATSLFQMYSAYLDAGFSEHQAFELTRTQLIAASGGES